MLRPLTPMGLLGVSLVTIQMLGLTDSWAAATAPFWGPPLFSLVWRTGKRVVRHTLKNRNGA